MKPDQGKPASQMPEESRRFDGALGETEAQYRAIIESSADGFWVVGGEGPLIAVNDAYVRRSGYSRAELLGMRVADLDAQETPADARRHLDKIRRQGSDVFETFHRTKSGEIWPVEVNVTYRPEAGGRFFAFMRDISKRKRLEAALRESEERFRLAMEAAAEGLWDWNLVTGDVYYSPGYATMLGYEPGELQPHVSGWIGLLHPDESDSIVRQAQDLLNDPGHYAMEFRLRRKDGGYCWVLSRGKVIESDATGKPRRAIGTHMDITERRRVRQALEEARNLLAEAQNLAHLGSFEFVVADGTTVWSDEEFRIYGLDPAGPSPSYEDMLARCIPPDDAPLLREAMHRMMEMPGTHEFEHRVVRPDGSMRWVYNRVHPYFDEQGRLLRYLGTTLDITERKRREEEAHKHGELMQVLAWHQVAVQTAAAFAHELNQPLVSIAAYNEVALRNLRGGREKAAQLAQAIEGSHAQALRAGQVLRELVEQLHRGAAEPRPFDLNALIKDVIEKFPRRGFDGLRAKLDLEPGLPAVRGNPLQTEKVLLNLIRNGMEAMEHAGVAPAAFAIVVRTLAGHNMAQVTVRDSGPGLDADTARRAFEPFFSTKANGLGLGLVISRSLIEAQEGQLWLDPEDGPGAVFHFTLPFADE